ncbi:transcriptional regulator [Elizabethkingia anophelis]|nr:transcriptional regulator [Elizabethkingia anophelis]
MDIKNDFLNDLGKRIAEYRAKNNQTLDDIEFITGIDSSDLSKYEQGKINLTIRTLLKLCQALNISPRELFDFEFDMEKYKIDE